MSVLSTPTDVWIQQTSTGGWGEYWSKVSSSDLPSLSPVSLVHPPFPLRNTLLEEQNAPEARLSTAAVAGIVVGVVIAVIITTGITWLVCLCRRKQRRAEQQAQADATAGGGDPYKGGIVHGSKKKASGQDNEPHELSSYTLATELGADNHPVE